MVEGFVGAGSGVPLSVLPIRSVRGEAEEGEKACRGESEGGLVDQMEGLNGGLEPHMLLLPRMDVVGVAGELELGWMGQGCRGCRDSFGQTDGVVCLNSGQLCWGSIALLPEVIPLNTPDRLKVLLGPKAEKELTELRLGLLPFPTGLHNPELSDPSLSTEERCWRTSLSLLPTAAFAALHPGLLSNPAATAAKVGFPF